MPLFRSAVFIAIGLAGGAQADERRDGTAYHVDAAAGDDANPGTDPAAPWKTLDRVNEAQPRLQPGDRVLFRRGRLFSGSLRVKRSGVPGAPIIYGAYGDGPKPEISGFASPSSWRPAGAGVWEAACPPGPSPVHLVTIDGTPRAMGRFPNADAPNGGYLTVTAHSGRGSITSKDLAADPDWTGGEAVIRKYRWVLDRDKILKHSGGTLALAPASSYEPVNGHGFFIQNHPRTLDAFGEWHFHPETRTLRVHLGAGDPDRHAILVSAVDVLVEARDRQDLVFEGLRLTGANRAAMRLDGSSRVTVRDCEIRWSGVNAVEGGHVVGIRMDDGLIEDTNNNAIAFPSGVAASAFRRLTIRNTAMSPGMGGSGDGTYNAMTLMGGDDVLVEAFRITDTGYIPVHFSGRRITVRDGFIENFCAVKDDGGGIYTFKGTADRTEAADRRITGNVVRRSRGAPAGAEGATKGFGIYLDDLASHVEVRGNVVEGTDGGIFLHNARVCQVAGNTFFDNTVQALFIHDDIAPGEEGAIRDITFTDNLLVSRTPEQLVLSARSVRDDFARFGTFERNIYARPADPDLIIEHGIRSGRPQAYDLEGRRATTGLEAGTRTAAVALPRPLPETRGPELVLNGDFATGLKEASNWSQPPHGELVWDREALDGGALHHRYTTPSVSPTTSLVMVRSGALVAGKRYLLRFSVLGSADHGSAGVRLRNGDDPWEGLTDYQNVRVDRTRREASVLLTAPSDRRSSIVEWAFNGRDGTFWLDNVALREAVEAERDPSIFRLEYNRSNEPRTIPLAEPWVDMLGRSYTDVLTLAPGASIVLLRKDACR